MVYGSLYMCISQWFSRLLLLSDSEEKFADFLHDSKVLQEGALIAGEVKIASVYQYRRLVLGIDSVTNTHLDNVAKNMHPKWQMTSNYPLKLFYLSGTVEAMPSKRWVYVCVYSSVKVSV